MIEVNLELDYSHHRYDYTANITVYVSMTEDYNDAGKFHTMEIEDWQYQDIPFFTNEDIENSIRKAVDYQYDDIFKLAVEKF